jgi:DNA ligase D
VADDVVLELDGREVHVSHPDKVFFTERGETKLDLVNYYLAVAEPLLDCMGGRPTLLQRFPNGAGGQSFFQKRVPKDAPEWLQTREVSTPNGTLSNALVAADIAHIIWAVNLGCLGFHPWPFHELDTEVDELRIDLDPQPGTTFDMAREAAHEVHQFLVDLGMQGYPKTTGNRGIHVYIKVPPVQDSYVVRWAAVALAREMERRRPDLLTAAWWKEERGSRIFVDFNQNAPHKTVFGAWCVRSREGAQVSTPFTWDELAALAPNELTVATVPARYAAGGDPWAAMYGDPQPLDRLLEYHRRDRAAGLMDAPWPPVYPKQPNEPPRVAPSRAKK